MLDNVARSMTKRYIASVVQQLIRLYRLMRLYLHQRKDSRHTQLVLKWQKPKPRGGVGGREHLHDRQKPMRIIDRESRRILQGEILAANVRFRRRRPIASQIYRK